MGVTRAVVTVGGGLGSLLVLSPWMSVLVPASGLPTLAAEIAMARGRARMVCAIGPAELREAFDWAHLRRSDTYVRPAVGFGIENRYRSPLQPFSALPPC